MENTIILIIVLLFFLLFAAAFAIIIFGNQTVRRPMLQNFSNDFECVIYRINLSVEEICAKLEKHDPQESFMDYEYDAAANQIRLSWFRYGSTTTYQVKVFENPEERILMLQYVEGMRIPQFSSNGGRAILEDLNLFWKCIADAEPIPFYKDRMYADAWSFWEEK